MSLHHRPGRDAGIRTAVDDRRLHVTGMLDAD
jgi:hypothetical protein